MSRSTNAEEKPITHGKIKQAENETGLLRLKQIKKDNAALAIILTMIIARCIILSLTDKSSLLNSKKLFLVLLIISAKENPFIAPAIGLTMGKMSADA